MRRLRRFGVFGALGAGAGLCGVALALGGVPRAGLAVAAVAVLLVAVLAAGGGPVRSDGAVPAAGLRWARGWWAQRRIAMVAVGSLIAAAVGVVIPATAPNLLGPAPVAEAATPTLLDVVVPAGTAGASATGATTDPAQDLRFTFSGTAGQRIFYKVTRPTSTTVNLVDPLNRSVHSAPGGTPAYGGPIVLAVSGPHGFLVDFPTGQTGSATIQVWSLPADVAGSMPTTGTATTITNTVPGQDGRYTFTGTVGQRIFLKTTRTSTNFRPAIVDPYGREVEAVPGAGNVNYLGPIVLQYAGTYQVHVDFLVDYVGSGSVQVWSPPTDVPGAVPTTGVSTTITNTVPGQDGRYTFTGTAGQRVLLKTTRTAPLGNFMPSIVDPTGKQVAAVQGGASVAYIEPVVLKYSGTYTVLADFQNDYVGSGAVQLWNVPADISVPATIGGGVVSGTTTAPGLDLRIPFTATAGQQVILTRPSTTPPVSVIDAYGRAITGITWTGTTTLTSSTILFSKAGTYTVLYDPAGDAVSTGSVTITSAGTGATQPADLTTTIALTGAATPLTTTLAGQDAVFTFNGTAGQRITTEVLGVGASNIRIVAPNGMVLASRSSQGTIEEDGVGLPVTGLYKILGDQPGTSVGTVTAKAWLTTANPTIVIPLTGAATTRNVAQGGQNALFTFTGSTGQRVTAEVQGTGSNNIRIIAPNGMTLASRAAQGTITENGVGLPANGTYTIVGDMGGIATGTVTAKAWLNTTDPTIAIPLTGVATTRNASQGGHSALFTFTGTAGQRVTAEVTGVGTGTASLVAPNGSVLASGTNGGLIANGVGLPAAGTYTIVGELPGITTGTVTAKAWNTGTEIPVVSPANGNPVSDPNSVAGRDVVVTFTATAGTQTTVAVSGTTGFATRLIRPATSDNATIWSSSSSTGTAVTSGVTALNATGVYQVLVDIGGTNTGTATVTIGLVTPSPFRAAKVAGKCTNCWFGADPINMVTGNYIDSAVDLPSVQYGMSWGRFYNSLYDDATMTPDNGSTTGATPRVPLARGWVHSFSSHLRLVPDGAGGYQVPYPGSGNITYVDATGRQYDLLAVAGGSFQRAKELRADLVAISGGWELRYDNGETARYDTLGRLTLMTNWDGQTATHTWASNTSPGPSTVTSSAGPTLTFTYVSGKLTQVAASDGRTVTYSTDAQGRWVVTDPTLKTRKYESDLDGRITKVLDGTGATELTNTYTGGRVTSQTTSSGATLTFAYDQTNRQTTVLNPATNESTLYRWDTEGRATGATDPYGKLVAYTYDTNGNRNSSTDRRAGNTVTTYDAKGNVLSVTDQTNKTTSGTYDSANRLLTVTDPNLKTTTYTYTGTNRIPTTITDPLGKVTQITSSNGLVSSRTDPDGVVESFTYNAQRRVAGVTNGLNQTTVYTYDTAGRLLSTTSPAGRVTAKEYDSVGRVTATIDAAGARTETTYDAAGRTATVTAPGALVTSYTYNAAGLVASMAEPQGTTTYVYDAENQLTSETSPAGTTTYTYGALGRIATVTAPTGVTSYGYNDDGLRATVTSPAGVTTTAYDAAGRVSSVVDPTGTTTYTYDPAGRVATVTDPAGRVTSTTYDDLGRALTVTRPGGAVTTTAYTPGGRVQSVTDPAGLPTSFTYDLAGRQATVTAPGGFTTTYGYDPDGLLTSQTSPMGRVTTTTYDTAGRVATLTDQAGVTITNTWNNRGLLATATKSGAGTIALTYNPGGQVATVTDPLGAVSTYGYDPAGRRTSRTDHLGGVQAWGYDSAGRLTSETDQLNRTTTHTYNAANRLATTTDPTGRVATYSYDPAGRLNQIINTLGAASETTTYGHDSAGRRTSSSNPAGAWAYTYDVGDRLTSVTAPGNRVTSWTWDNAGRRTGMTYPNGTALTYNYHATTGRLTNIINGATTVAGYTYNNDGQPLSVNAVGTNRTWAYNTGGQLTNYVQPTAGSGAFLNTTLTYDSAGRIATDTTNTTIHTYSYDLADQLLSNNRTAQPGLPAETRTYTYDALGRRATKAVNGISENYTYNAAGELLTAGATTHTYDAAGRLTNVSSPTPGLQNPNATHTYNAAGKLTSTQITAGGTGPHTTARGYDPSGNLTQVNAGTIDWDLADGLPQPLLGVDVFGPTGLVATTQAGNWKATVHDAHGSIINQTSPSSIGATQGAAYNEYGINADAPLGLARGYHSELEIDGITHLRAHDYHAPTGRFTTTDPLDGVNGTTTIANPYHYTNNNPTNLTDPTGLRPGDRPSGGDEEMLTCDSVSPFGWETLDTFSADWPDGKRWPTECEAFKALYRAFRDPDLPGYEVSGICGTAGSDPRSVRL